MRLLFISSVYPTPWRPHKGAFNRGLVAGLRQAGDEVRVLAPVPWTEALRGRARATAAPAADERFPVWLYPPGFAHATRHHWMARHVVPAARALTRDWRPDLVIGYWTHPDGTVAMDVADALDVPGAVMVGGSDVMLLANDPARRPAIVDTLRRARGVLTVGDALRDRVIALGIGGDRVHPFARGVDRGRFFPGDAATARRALGLPIDRPIALWVGHMVPVKGVDVLLEAWRALPAAPLLVLVGDGAARPRLQRAAESLGDRVRFAGAVPHAELPDWFRAADLFVLPSRSEGIPNVLLESLACGTPFVASDVGGVASLLEPESRVVPPGDVAALVRALHDRLPAAPLSRRATARVLDRAQAIADLRTTLRAVAAT